MKVNYCIKTLFLSFAIYHFECSNKVLLLLYILHHYFYVTNHYI